MPLKFIKGIRFLCLFGFFFNIVAPCFVFGVVQNLDSQTFQKNLTEMLKRQEASIQLLRNQIVSSDHAPFLPQLYIQLAEGLDKKANILYFIQTEKTKDPQLSAKAPLLIGAQKDALQIYQKILIDFADFEKMDLVLFRLAEIQKRLGQDVAFFATAQQLLKKFPRSDYAIKAQLLLADAHFDQGDFLGSLRILEPVLSSHLIYEKNVARRKAGLSYLGLSQHVKALNMFEHILLDDQLKKENNPNASVPLDADHGGGLAEEDLKRVVLIDSILAYTVVYAKKPDPIGYYLKISPTQQDYKVVLEKLAARYIDLKQYVQAINILRTLSGLLQDVRRVLIIYHQILMTIPFSQRQTIRVEEMHFCMDVLQKWIAFYPVSANEKRRLKDFFEIQLRQLATSTHENAKHLHQKELFKKAVGFYKVYLATFKENAFTEKMALNLADAQFFSQDYVESGQTYLDLASGQYGKVSLSDKQKFFENAILSLHDKFEFFKSHFSFYEKVRATGLLIRSIEDSFKFFPHKKENPVYVYLLAKAYLEQGFLPQAIEALFAYIKRFPQSRNVADAVELIIDYYNTKAEYITLEQWVRKITALHLSDPKIKARLSKVMSLTHAKSLEQQVEKVTEGDIFSEGKGYLKAALVSKNPELRSELLKNALQKAKAEADVDTFINVAEKLATNMPKAQAQGIYQDLGTQLLLIADYNHASGIFQKAYALDPSHAQSRVVLDQWANVKLGLRDWDGLSRDFSSGLLSKTSPEIQKRFQEQASDALRSVRLPAAIVANLLSQSLANDALLVLWKAKDTLPGDQKHYLEQVVAQRCQGNKRLIFCAQDRFLTTSINGLSSASHAGGIKGLEALSKQFQTLSSDLKSYQGSGDPNFEAAVSSQLYKAYTQFADLLMDVKLPAEFSEVVRQKSRESQKFAQTFLQDCKKILQKSTSSFQEGVECGRSKQADFFKMKLKPLSAVKNVDSDAQVKTLQKQIFVQSSPHAILDLATQYYRLKAYHQAIALTTNSIANDGTQEKALSGILGCSLKALGYEDEAVFHLKKAAQPNCVE